MSSQPIERFVSVLPWSWPRVGVVRLPLSPGADILRGVRGLESKTVDELLAIELIRDPETGGLMARLPDIPAYGEGEAEAPRGSSS